jgi:hypothetical protein
VSAAIGSRFFGLTAALASCFSQTVLAQDVPGQKLDNLRFCDSPYEIVVVTNDDALWESRVKTGRQHGRQGASGRSRFCDLRE